MSIFIQLTAALTAAMLVTTASADEAKTCPADPAATCGDEAAAPTAPAAEDLDPSYLYQRVEAERLRAVLEHPEIPGVRIGWQVNQPFQDFMQGIDDGKPLVLFFTARDCAFCNRMVEKFACPEIGRFAGQAVFSASIPIMNRNAMQLFDAVEGDAYPTIAVLRPDPNAIHVVGRAVGELTVPQLDEFLRDSLGKFYEVQDRGRPAVLDEAPSVEALETAWRDAGLEWTVPDICAQ